jgi:fructan beta-fructosidase
MDTKWLDYGPDEYAGITWANTGNRRIFLGWMSNWLYANAVPTETWRNAMTIPRELKLKHVGNSILLASEPVKELSTIQSKPFTAISVSLSKSVDIKQMIQKFAIPCSLRLSAKQKNDFAVTLSNDVGEKLVVGFNKKQDQYFIDRTHSGRDGFEKDFPGVHSAPRLAAEKAINIYLIIDVSSIELFADDGLTVMTEIFFPTKPYDHLEMNSSSNMVADRLTYSTLHSIWQAPKKTQGTSNKQPITNN